MKHELINNIENSVNTLFLNLLLMKLCNFEPIPDKNEINAKIIP